MAAYNGAVLEAVRDAGDQLSTLKSLQGQQREQQASLANAESTLSLAESRFGAGLSNRLAVLNARDRLLLQQRQALDLRSQALDSQGQPDARARRWLERRSRPRSQVGRRKPQETSPRTSIPMSNSDNTSTPAAAPATVTPVSIPASNSSKRKTALTLLSVVVAIGLVGYIGYEYVIGKRTESTDNAYVNANVVQITPLVGGTVKAIRADDTDFVKAGQPLVSLDPADAKVALDQASSQLAQTVREVRTLYANNGTYESQVKLREADVKRMQSELDRLQGDVARRQPLVASGAVGKEEYDHAVSLVTSAKSAVASAQSALQGAQDQLNSNRVLTEGTDAAEHPNVQRAAARMREAYLAMQRTDLQSPVDGWVAPPQRATGPARGRRRAADGRGRPAERLGRCQLQGKPGRQAAHRSGRQAGGRRLRGQGSSSPATSSASRLAPARPSRCCPRRTPPATGSRSCSACRCASRWTRSRWPNIRCASACRWKCPSTSRTGAAGC